MSRARIIHRCSSCGATTARWMGRCPSCGAWNSLEEALVEPQTALHRHAPGAGRSPSHPVELPAIPSNLSAPVPTGVGELDRVLSGGLVPGSVTLLAGEPGTGKSTLLLQVLASAARAGRRALLVAAEESPAQVRGRAARLEALIPGLWLIAEAGLLAVEQATLDIQPDVMVIDSIQAVCDTDTAGSPGSVTQVRACTQRLVSLAKSSGTSALLVGHVTKDGAIAGPRVLEHAVDTVLSFEGDRHHALRLLRSVKHRFGAAGELGVLEMTAGGLEGVADPSGLFLGDRHAGVPGSVVFAHMDGRRPLLVEVQALVAPSQMASPRRSASGFDVARLALLTAVLERRVGLSLARHDVYLSVAGGVRLCDPAADLAVCLALASAAADQPERAGAVVMGEVGLAGEVRQVAQASRRLAEAARLGFRSAIVPAASPAVPGIDLQRVDTLSDALEAAFVGPRAGVNLKAVG